MNLLEQKRAQRRKYNREYSRLKRARNHKRGLTSQGKPRKRVGLAMTSGAAAMRKHRAQRLRDGWLAVWMIGYDGPKPYPESAWPRIAEHAIKFGL